MLRYRWTGREWDAETGWYFHRSRYYDPEVGRFVQEDKVGYGGGNNLYAYVSGDVLQARDPNGLTKDATWAYLGWGDLCLGVDLCFGGGGELRPLTAGATYGQRNANQLLASAFLVELNHAIDSYLRTPITIALTDPATGLVLSSATVRMEDLLQTHTCEPCKRIATGTTYFGRISLTAGYGLGGTVSWGHYFDNTGIGVWKRGGLVAGYGISAAVEGGHSKSFAGYSVTVEGSKAGPGFGGSFGLSNLSLSGTFGWTFTPFSLFVTGTHTWQGSYLWTWQ